mmetsp:Transcript_38991/g.59303  ORF Transcript_38991/g.59303 Transcript_38991/m.59303 type:complete len:138 (+) Transcript_38991:315-728(+)
MVHPTQDLDDLIRDFFLVNFQCKIHTEVLDYFFKITQHVIVTLTTPMLAPTDSQEYKAAYPAYITFLRFAESIMGDGMSPYDEDQRLVQQPKPFYLGKIIEVAHRSTDLHLQKLTAMAMAFPVRGLIQMDKGFLRGF